MCEENAGENEDVDIDTGPVNFEDNERVYNSETERTIALSREPLLYLEFNKPNKQNVSEINLFKKFSFSQCQNNCWHAD